MPVVRSALAWLLALFLVSGPAAADVDIEEVLAGLGFPADTLERARAGEMVRVDLASSHERELAAGLAFIVKEERKEFARQMFDGLLEQVDQNVGAWGPIEGEGSAEQLAKLRIDALESAYRSAAPGTALNLSSAEIQALRALAAEPDAALRARVVESLLERYRAYRERGLDGIAPYARSGGQREPGSDLRKAVQAASDVKKRAPVYYDALLRYPQKPDTGFREKFLWQRYEAQGEPTLILEHVFTVEEGETLAAVQRQFYVSGGFNCEQAMVGLLPVPEGTLMVYVNRTSTDQVAGFGGGAKRKIGVQLLGSQLQALYDEVRQVAAEQ